MTSVILGDYVYGLDSYGAMRCLDLQNGDRVWEDQTLVDEGRWATAFFVQNGSGPGCLPKRGARDWQPFTERISEPFQDKADPIRQPSFKGATTTFYGRIQPMRIGTYSFAMTSN